MEISNVKTCCQLERVILCHSKKKITDFPINLSLPAQKRIALIGRNGSGKTTLLKAILGENVKCKGKILLFDSFEPNKVPSKILSKFIAFLPQEHIYPPDIKVYDYLKLSFLPKIGIFGKMPDGADKEIFSMMEIFNLNFLKSRRLSTLSSGEKQLVFLARTFLQKPKLLILDEPTNHLDRVAGSLFWNLITNMDLDVSIIISTHDLSFVKKYTNWIIALKKGNLFFSGPSETFWNSKICDELFESPIVNLC